MAHGAWYRTYNIFFYLLVCVWPATGQKLLEHYIYTMIRAHSDHCLQSRSNNSNQKLKKKKKRKKERKKGKDSFATPNVNY